MIKRYSAILIFILILPLIYSSGVQAQSSTDIRKLRLSFHVFNDDGGFGNFQADSVEHMRFFHELEQWINHKMLNLETLKPSVESAFVKSMNTQIVIDTILFHQDTYAWDCSDSLDSEYMRHIHVDKNDWMDYSQKNKTLPIFFGDNYGVVGGHVAMIGSKRLIAMRGVYTMYKNRGFDKTVYECGRNVFHELGHALGLNHNFQGGVSGDQCDECDDNGCPQEGTSNNLMDYWPGYGGGISVCQLDIINRHLKGEAGSIGDIVINDSCYIIDNQEPRIISEYTRIDDTLYIRRPWHIVDGGVLEITGTVSVGHNLGLKVFSGGQLILNSCKLTNFCGDIWDGIVAEGDAMESNPIILLSGDTKVEHARIAIHAIGAVELNLTHGEFLNCEKSIELSDCNIEDNYFGSLTFTSQGRYHRAEEGASLNSFIFLSNSTMSILNSFFVNTDKYMSQSVDESGVGIRVQDSRLESFGNVFQFLSNGIVAKELGSASIVVISNNQFDYCLNSVFNDGYSYFQVDNSTFNINKFEGISATGIVANSAGWMLIENSKFVSDYGGGGIIGIYRKGSRGGTQLVRHNDFTKLDWGVIQVPDLDELVWPIDPDQEPGFVLDENSYVEVPLKYSYITPDGQGLAQTDYEFPKDLTRLEETLNWPVGGIGGVANQENLVFVGQGGSGYSTAYPQENFFINAQANLGVEGVIPDMSYLDLMQQWAEPQIVGLDPDTDVPSWIHASQIFEDNPHLLRQSAVIENKLNGIAHWPRWALEQFIGIAGEANKLDKDLAYYTVKYANESIIKVQMSELSISIGLRSPNQDSVLLLEDVSPPKDLFLPGFIRQAIPEDASFSVYPNPVSEFIYIQPDNQTSIDISSVLEYVIYTSSGRFVKRGVISEIDNLSVSVSEFSSGLYTICLRDVKSFYGAKKFIILHP